MKITVIDRIVLIIITIIVISMIPVTIPMMAKVSAAKQSNKPYMDTELTKKEQAEFFKEYKKYNISKKNGILYYKKKPIRCFADIYRVSEPLHNNGTIVTCKGAYKYFNENGIVDIYVERTKNTDHTKKLFGSIIKKGNLLKDFIFVMPENVIKKVVNLLNKKGEYKNLVDIACFIDKNTIGKVAEKMAKKEKYKELLTIACFVDRNTMDEIAKKMTDKGEYKEVLNMCWCISQDAANEIAKKMAHKRKYKEMLTMSWCISQDTINEIAKKAAKKKYYQEIVNMAYCVSKDVLREIAEKMEEENEQEALDKIRFFIA